MLIEIKFKMDQNETNESRYGLDRSSAKFLKNK